ncbi:MAG: hypothetical protein AAGC61_08170 [Microbacterium sp.]
MACRYAWCETPADIHAEDPSYHTRELGHGMKLTVENNGMPGTNWMPDWSEWWIDKPEDAGTEYESVIAMLRDLPKNYREFREALVNDPLFIEEVATMRAELKGVKK